MHFERIRAVLQIVRNTEPFAGQFLGLAHGHEAHSQRVGQRRSEDESARLDADDQIGSRALVAGFQAVNDTCEPTGILEQRGDVVKQDAGLGKSGTSRISVFRSFIRKEPYCCTAAMRRSSFSGGVGCQSSVVSRRLSVADGC